MTIDQRERSIRSFLAVPVTDEVAEPLMKSVETSLEALPPLRQTARKNLHLTLVFLGSITESALNDKLIPRVSELLRDAKPGRIHFRQVAGFPSGEAPKHLVLEGYGSPSVDALRQSLNEGLRELKTKEGGKDKAWRPHITLGRFRERRTRPVAPTPWQVELPVGQVILYESETTLHGPVYRARHQWTL